jgi:hypothetical protein
MPPQQYLQVAHRLVWFREEHPDWSIETERVEYSDKHAIFKARILNASGRIMATAHKKETASDFGDFLEKAETSAIGRALALCGYGTQFAPDLDEGDRLSDAPLDPKHQNVTTLKTNRNNNQSTLSPEILGDYKIEFGQQKGRSLSSFHPDELVLLISDVEAWAKKNSKTGTPTGMVKTFIDNANLYLESLIQEGSK